jgi:hypothetical protein
MRGAFKAVNAQMDDGEFLILFQASGCYLTDLYPKPVDHLDIKSRRRARVAGEQLLSENSSGFDQRRLHRCCARL